MALRSVATGKFLDAQAGSDQENYLPGDGLTAAVAADATKTSTHWTLQLPAARTRAIRSTAMWSTSKADGRASQTRRATFSVSRMSIMRGSGSTHLGTTSREPFGRYVELGWPREFGIHKER